MLKALFWTSVANTSAAAQTRAYRRRYLQETPTKKRLLLILARTAQAARASPTSLFA